VIGMSVESGFIRLSHTANCIAGIPEKGREVLASASFRRFARRNDPVIFKPGKKQSVVQDTFVLISV
jgi:hypothetical protein